MSWQENAACKGQPVKLFVGSKDVHTGRRFCAECPVRDACLEFAMADDTLVGTWGGTSDAERDEIRRSRRRTPTAVQVMSLIEDGQWHPLSWVIAAHNADRDVRKRRAAWTRTRLLSGEFEELVLPDGTRMVRIARAAREAAA